MSQVFKIVRSLTENQQNVKFQDLYKVCVHYFGEPRNTGGSHYVFRTGWQGDPRVNIQNAGGYAKRYQVVQVLRAIERLKEIENGKITER